MITKGADSVIEELLDLKSPGAQELFNEISKHVVGFA